MHLFLAGSHFTPYSFQTLQAILNEAAPLLLKKQNRERKKEKHTHYSFSHTNTELTLLLTHTLVVWDH